LYKRQLKEIKNCKELPVIVIHDFKTIYDFKYDTYNGKPLDFKNAEIKFKKSVDFKNEMMYKKF
jgi:hypothetical protein